MAKTVAIGPYSAYAIAVAAGYQGTEEEWLASLVGPQGPQGAYITGAALNENSELILTIYDPATQESTTINAGSIDTSSAVQAALQQIQQAAQEAVNQIQPLVQQTQQAATAASASAEAAQQSAENAASSHSAAASSAQAAAASQAAAMQSAADAAGSAETAGTSASTAAQSAGEASASAAAAAASEQAAAASQTAAAQSASAASGSAQAAASSASDAQQAAQEALGFRTFFSAVTPDENGDLDPSRPMTTPTAASVTVKSKGDRIQSVQVNGFTQQAGSGDASPDNVREISTAGMKMLALVLTGTEAWALRSFGAYGPQFELPLTYAPSIGTDQSLAVQTQKCSVCIVNNADNYQGECAWAFSTGAQSRLRVRLFGATTVAGLKQELSNRYEAGTPVVFWYVPADESQATGLYIPVETQGHEYRCQCLELTAPLCDGDKVESCVPSGCDKRIVFDGSEDESWTTTSVTGAFRISFASDYNGLSYGSNLYFGGTVVDSAPYGSYIISGGNLYIKLDGVESIEVLRSTLAANPFIIWYRSTAYTKANDIPVQLETHAQAELALDGTDYVGTSSIVGESGFYCFLSNKTLDAVFSYDNDAVCSHLKNAKKQLVAEATDNLNSFCVANSQYGLRFAISHEVLGTTPQTSVADCTAAVKAYFAAQYAAGTPITIAYPLASPAIYAHDPVTIVAIPYTQADVDAANQLANTPSTLPAIDSPDVPMLLDETDNADSAAQVMALAANAVPVAGTYVVSSQDGTTLAVSLKAMQDGGDAATLGGLTLDDVKQLISDAVTAAVALAQGGTN